MAVRSRASVRRAAVVSAIVLVGGLGLAACSDAGPAPGVGPFPSPTTTTTSAPPVTLAPLGFSDADNGRSADASVGQRITVILHSSEFVFGTPSDPAVVQADGDPTVTLAGDTCVETPESGCGTVVASFVGVAPGDATLQADRADGGQWRLSVRVVDGSAPVPTFGSEVRGTVVFSPVCPVETEPPDPACAPRAGRATVEVARPDGIVVAQDRTGDDGQFAMAVPPGTYTVHGFPPASAVGGGCQSDPAEVVVEPDLATTVTVTCDTGIR